MSVGGGAGDVGQLVGVVGHGQIIGVVGSDSAVTVGNGDLDLGIFAHGDGLVLGGGDRVAGECGGFRGGHVHSAGGGGDVHDRVVRVGLHVHAADYAFRQLEVIAAGLQNPELHFGELPFGHHGLAGRVQGAKANFTLLNVIFTVKLRVNAHDLEHFLVVAQIHLECKDSGNVVACVQINAELVADGQVGLAGRYAQGRRGFLSEGGDRQAENQENREEQAHGFLKNFHNILLSEVVLFALE